MRRAMAAIGPFSALRNRILKPRNPLIFHPYSFPTSLQRFASFSPSTTSASFSSSSLSSSPSLSSLDSGNTLCSSTSFNYINLEPYLGCSMLGRRLKVAVLLSGGVDSSVALRLLHAAGHSCTAFYLKIWFQVLNLFDFSCSRRPSCFAVIIFVKGRIFFGLKVESLEF